MPTPEQVQQYDERGYFIAEDTVGPAVAGTKVLITFEGFRKLSKVFPGPGNRFPALWKFPTF